MLLDLPKTCIYVLREPTLPVAPATPPLSALCSAGSLRPEWHQTTVVEAMAKGTEAGKLEAVPRKLRGLCADYHFDRPPARHRIQIRASSPVLLFKEPGRTPRHHLQ